jgi:hypothetical protein
MCSLLLFSCLAFAACGCGISTSPLVGVETDAGESDAAGIQGDAGTRLDAETRPDATEQPDATSPVTSRTRVYLTSGGGTASSAGYRAFVTVGAPQPYGSTVGSNNLVLVGPKPNP